MEPDQLAAEALCRTRISEYHNKIISASLDDLKSKTESIPNLLALLPSPYPTSLNDRRLARAYQYILMCWFVTNERICPKEMQLRAAIGIWEGKDVFIQAGTGTGKTLAAILNQLLEPLDGVLLIISPLKRLQYTQVCLILEYSLLLI